MDYHWDKKYGTVLVSTVIVFYVEFKMTNAELVVWFL